MKKLVLIALLGATVGTARSASVDDLPNKAARQINSLNYLVSDLRAQLKHTLPFDRLSALQMVEDALEHAKSGNSYEAAQSIKAAMNIIQALRNSEALQDEQINAVLKRTLEEDFDGF